MSIGKKLENLFAAVAFAEAGEHETAREIAAGLDEKPAKAAEPSPEKISPRPAKEKRSKVA